MVVIIHRLEVMTAVIRNQARNQVNGRKVDDEVRRVRDPGPGQDQENDQVEKIATEDIVVQVQMRADRRPGDQAKNRQNQADDRDRDRQDRRNDDIKLSTKQLCYN